MAQTEGFPEGVTFNGPKIVLFIIIVGGALFVIWQINPVVQPFLEKLLG